MGAVGVRDPGGSMLEAEVHCLGIPAEPSELRLESVAPGLGESSWLETECSALQ